MTTTTADPIGLPTVQQTLADYAAARLEQGGAA